MIRILGRSSSRAPIRSQLSSSSKLILKEIRIDALDQVAVGCRYADSVVEHQLSQLFPIDQDDTTVEPFCVLPRILRKC